MPSFNLFFTTRRFWSKARRAAASAGHQVMEKVLWLYFAAQDPATPLWARQTIYGALGYWIVPTDAVPDLLPGGYADDLGVLTAAVGAVAVHITPEVKRKAKRLLHTWFGGEDSEDEGDEDKRGD